MRWGVKRYSDKEGEAWLTEDGLYEAEIGPDTKTYDWEHEARDAAEYEQRLHSPLVSKGKIYLFAARMLRPQEATQ